MTETEKLFNFSQGEIEFKIASDVSPYEGYIAYEFSDDKKIISVKAVDRDEKLINWMKSQGYDLKNFVDFHRYVEMVFEYD